MYIEYNRFEKKKIIIDFFYIKMCVWRRVISISMLRHCWQSRNDTCVDICQLKDYRPSCGLFHLSDIESQHPSSLYQPVVMYYMNIIQWNACNTRYYIWQNIYTYMIKYPLAVDSIEIFIKSYVMIWIRIQNGN